MTCYNVITLRPIVSALNAREKFPKLLTIVSFIIVPARSTAIVANFA